LPSQEPYGDYGVTVLRAL